jgi:hypothetical protein
MRRCLVVVLVLGALSVLPAAVGAPSSERTTTAPVPRAPGLARPWPRGRIRYLDRTSAHDSVRTAVRAWNASGVGVRFVRVGTRARAQVVIDDYDRACGFGIANSGYYRGRRTQAFVATHDLDGSPCPWPEVVLKTVHELGHVLGISGHVPETTCAIMNETTLEGMAPTGCYGPDEHPSAGTWWCRMIARPDLRLARRLYGGQPRERPTEWCDTYTRTTATGPVTAYGSASGSNSVLVTATRVPEAPVPSWVVAQEGGAHEPGVRVQVSNDGCVTDPGAPTEAVVTWNGTPVGGATSSRLFWSGETVPGLTCVTTWQLDVAGNPAARPTTAVVQLSPDEPSEVARGRPGELQRLAGPRG